MKTLKYYLALPYTTRIKRDEDGDFVATVQELPGCSMHGSTELEAVQNLAEVKELWLTDAIERNHPIPEPVQDEDLPSGRWVQRVTRHLHKQLVVMARQEGVSLNYLVGSLLAEAVGTSKTRNMPTPGTAVAEDRPKYPRKETRSANRSKRT